MIENIIFCEDGSVDTDELIENLSEKTKVIVYRQGGKPPTIQQLEKPIETSYEALLAKEAIEKETAREIFEALGLQFIKPYDKSKLIYKDVINYAFKRFGIEVKE